MVDWIDGTNGEVLPILPFRSSQDGQVSMINALASLPKKLMSTGLAR
jgi:hypothetical protein